MGLRRLNNWLKIQTVFIRDNLTVIPDKTPFIHISKNPKLGKMSPWIGTKQMKNEDRTIPRICGSADILGCILGYSIITEELHDSTQVINDVEVPWDGTYTVYSLANCKYVAPSKKLVPDADVTKELWIVPYSPESVEMVPKVVGELVLSGWSSVRDCIGESNEWTFVLNNYEDMAIDGRPLPPGFHVFTVVDRLHVNEAGEGGHVRGVDEYIVPRQEFGTIKSGNKKQRGG